MQHGDHLSDTLRSVRRSVANWEETGELSCRASSGLKVKAFCRSLLGDESAVTLDTWMAEALWVDQQRFGTVSGYADGVKLVNRTAKRIGICPRDCQAAIWCGIIRDLGQTPAKLDLLAEWSRFVSLGKKYGKGAVAA